MHTLAEVVNDNSISGIALAFFATLITGVVTVLIQVIKSKQAIREAGSDASDAAKKAEQARKNTENVSNGFASGVDRKLTFIIDEISRLKSIADNTSESVTNHLEWHLEKESKK